MLKCKQRKDKNSTRGANLKSAIVLDLQTRGSFVRVLSQLISTPPEVMFSKKFFARMLVFYLTLVLLQIFQTSASCVDENGNNVDWVVMYKLPKHSKFSNNNPHNSYIDEGEFKFETCVYSLWVFYFNLNYKYFHNYQ